MQLSGFLPDECSTLGQARTSAGGNFVAFNFSFVLLTTALEKISMQMRNAGNRSRRITCVARVSHATGAS